ncbi:MAG: hypothetical protein HY819_22495 [Acidobacteria bacterium]|nr:hypothetical protein [Acidobacteriota bacterium]
MSNQSTNLKWINSSGGPLVLIPKHLSYFWMGYYFNLNDSLVSPFEITSEELTNLHLATSKTDYDRACEIEEYLAPIRVDSGIGLVITGEICPTSWWQEEFGGMLVRINYASDANKMPNYLTNLPDSIWEKENFCFDLQDDHLLLFDSVEYGKDISDLLEITLQPSNYQIFTANYSPNSETALIIHKFTKA